MLIIVLVLSCTVVNFNLFIKFRFLFEIKDDIILYTGDFRFENLDTFESTFQFLESKRIQKCYLDTTFCDEFYLNFPTRDVSIQQIITLIKKQEKDVQVYLALDMLGTEPIITAIANTFQTKV